MIDPTRRQLAAALLVLPLVLAVSGRATAADAGKWDEVLTEARGQTVYFNAWGGADNINAYIRWAGEEMRSRFGVNVVHVKLDDTAKAVSTVVAEKTAGRDDSGSVDLVWINGENFAAMKTQDLLFKPDWASRLPNWRFVGDNPSVRRDFTLPTEGLESPWGAAKLVFFHDEARTPASELPDSAADLLTWAKAHPGRFSYPQPPDFMGTTFLKQVLAELAADRENCSGRSTRRRSKPTWRRSLPISTHCTRCCGARARHFQRIIPT